MTPRKKRKTETSGADASETSDEDTMPVSFEGSHQMDEIDTLRSRARIRPEYLEQPQTLQDGIDGINRMTSRIWESSRVQSTMLAEHERLLRDQQKSFEESESLFNRESARRASVLQRARAYLAGRQQRPLYVGAQAQLPLSDEIDQSRIESPVRQPDRRRRFSDRTDHSATSEDTLDGGIFLNNYNQPPSALRRGTGVLPLGNNMEEEGWPESHRLNRRRTDERSRHVLSPNSSQRAIPQPRDEFSEEESSSSPGLLLPGTDSPVPTVVGTALAIRTRQLPAQQVAPGTDRPLPPSKVRDASGEIWESISNNEAVAELFDNEVAAMINGKNRSHFLRLLRSDTDRSGHCIQCHVIRHRRGDCRINLLQQACDHCVKAKRPCAILAEVDGQQSICWLAQPGSGAEWGTESFWVP